MRLHTFRSEAPVAGGHTSVILKQVKSADYPQVASAAPQGLAFLTFSSGTMTLTEGFGWSFPIQIPLLNLRRLFYFLMSGFKKRTKRIC